MRIRGEVRGSNGSIEVMTNWIDAPVSEIRGIMIGLELRGWKDTEIEAKEPNEETA